MKYSWQGNMVYFNFVFSLMCAVASFVIFFVVVGTDFFGDGTSVGHL